MRKNVREAGMIDKRERGEDTGIEGKRGKQRR